jgi:hypothetical protein
MMLEAQAIDDGKYNKTVDQADGTSALHSHVEQVEDVQRL